MAAVVIGRVKAGSGKSCQVKWDEASRDVYVELTWGYWVHAGKASSAHDAMVRAEAHVYNK